jgi:hypothetical protein
MQSSSEIPERLPVSSPLDAIGGEPLAGSGFESEPSDSDFSSFSESAEE